MIKKICITLMTIAILSGCGSSNIDKTYEITNAQIEEANLQEDYFLLQKINEVYAQNMKATKNNDEKCVVTLKYLDDVYQLASNRYDLDYMILSAFSDNYINYIAACYVYGKTYLEEKDELIKDKNISEEEYMKTNTNTGIMLVELEKILNDTNQ